MSQPSARAMSDGARAPVSVVVLTHDESLNLPACLGGVAGWAAELFVVEGLR